MHGGYKLGKPAVNLEYTGNYPNLENSTNSQVISCNLRKNYDKQDSAIRCSFHCAKSVKYVCDRLAVAHRRSSKKATAGKEAERAELLFLVICHLGSLRGCQTNDKVGRLLWAWFSCPTKSADKIGEPWHTADIFVCYCVRYQLAQQPNADLKIILASLLSASNEGK